MTKTSSPGQLCKPTSIGSAQFRKGLSQFGTGVTIVTSRFGEQIAGVTVNSFASVSLDPLIVLWSLRKSSSSLDIYKHSDTFIIHILAGDQIALANKFARASGDKFTGVHFTEGCEGAPLLPEVSVALECRKYATHEGGDHLIFLGEVIGIHDFQRPPLLFVGGCYALAFEHPAQRAKPAYDIEEKAKNEEGCSEPFMRLARKVAENLSDRLETYRAAEGLGRNHALVLGHIRRHPLSDVAFLVSATRLCKTEVHEALELLLSQGFIHDVGGQFQITASGIQRQTTLEGRTHNLEALKIAQFSPEEVETAKRVLSALGERL